MAPDAFVLPVPAYGSLIANALGLRDAQVKAALRLLEDGNTIPFIARYRKEMTGELDENQLRAVESRYSALHALYERKCDVVRLLVEQGVLVHEDDRAAQILRAIGLAGTVTEVDDIYRPFRPKRKTRASVARERGLAPLAAWLQAPENGGASEADVRAIAASYVQPDIGVTSADDALQGAADIIAEEVADDAALRQWIRKTTWRLGVLQSTAVDDAAQTVYERYYAFRERVASVAPYRVLAMFRGEREGHLKIAIAAPTVEILQYAARHVVAQGSSRLGVYVSGLLQAAVEDGYKRLMAPAIERDIRHELMEKAEEQAIRVFAMNVRPLLLQPPILGRVVLGVDPAYRTGCKLAVVDDTGKLLHVTVVYPTPPQNKVEAARTVVLQLLATYGIELIAIGNGTASRETEAFVAECIRAYRETAGREVPYVMVSEAGASVYSASPLAGEEFPELDVSERSAISIARRVQDPLAELVKIDPKSIGVGQYQHDVSQKKLGETLAGVVETAVNEVGVDVNTASPSLLSYVAGINPTTAKNIVLHREAHGRFTSRKSLAAVPRLGPKAWQQCVGFLRIVGGSDVLDETPIHPETYPAVRKLLPAGQAADALLRDSAGRKAWLANLRARPLAQLSVETGIGEPTLRDILSALEQPGRDPRDSIAPPLLRTDVLRMEDLAEGMVLTGTVRNVVDFGAFVDVGVKQDGLVHISQLADRFVSHPMDIVAVGDVVRVRVVQVDVKRQRLGLSMKAE